MVGLGWSGPFVDSMGRINPCKQRVHFEHPPPNVGGIDQIQQIPRRKVVAVTVCRIHAAQAVTSIVVVGIVCDFQYGFRGATGDKLGHIRRSGNQAIIPAADDGVGHGYRIGEILHVEIDPREQGPGSIIREHERPRASLCHQAHSGVEIRDDLTIDLAYRVPGREEDHVRHEDDGNPWVRCISGEGVMLTVHLHHVKIGQRS